MKKEGLHTRPYLLITSALSIVVAVVFAPVANAILMSFQNYDLRRPREIVFIGPVNYIEILHDLTSWGSLLRTVLWAIFGVGFQFLFGLILMNSLNKSFKGRGIIRFINLIPWVAPGVLIGLVWRWIYDGSYGVLNDLLKKVGLIDMPILFLTQESTVIPSMIVTVIWQGIPLFALILFTSPQEVPAESYKAVDIDGANGA